MTKAGLADAIYRRHGALSRREAIAVVDVILQEIRKGLASRRPVKISGFGSFSVVRRRSRVGRNPRTGTAVEIPGRSSPVFRPSRKMVFHLNPGGRARPMMTGARGGN